MSPYLNNTRANRFLARLRQDSAGNTLAMIAAGLFPLLALVGGGIDMGRSYLSQTRLQQACDAGVLAARKKLGSAVVVDGNVPADVATIGNRFFNLNFRDGSYGTEGRDFEMALEEDYAISGVAVVDVPTTIMTLFGYDQMPISVKCEANLNFSNTDVMFVLDTTGSMKETNPSDSEPRINILRTVVKNFRTQMEGSASPNTRVRYGFVPYATNVNVGGLLEDDWVVDDWIYQSRENVPTATRIGTHTANVNYSPETGSVGPTTIESSYAATFHPAASEYETSYYSCDNATPAGTYTSAYEKVGSPVTEPFAGPPAGEKVTQRYRYLATGIHYATALSGTTCNVQRREFNNYSFEFDQVVTPKYETDQIYRYAPIPRNVASWRSEVNGCIEERGTYEIDDWDNVDFGQALDLDIDTVPTAGVPATQWRPRYPNIIFERELSYYGSSGSFNTAEKITDYDHYFKPSQVSSLVACPTASQKLKVWDTAAFNTYVDTLQVGGTTYHDIGMIWGGRLISPTGLFADENVDIDGKTTARHLIFLTDGKTETFDVAYGAYGVEPLDRRRWRSASESGMDLDQVVEKRFAVVCEEVKKRNVTVWIIGFGVALDEFMTKCAGAGHHFEAGDAGELNDVFSTIAAQMGELRISK